MCSMIAIMVKPFKKSYSLSDFFVTSEIGTIVALKWVIRHGPSQGRPTELRSRYDREGTSGILKKASIMGVLIR